MNSKDMVVLRRLASEYAEAAALPMQDEKRRLWRKLNALSMERPMVVIDQMPWGELNTKGDLDCQVQDPYWRGVEQQLRRTLYQWKYLPVDMVLNPYISLPRPVHNSGWGISVVEDTIAYRAGDDSAVLSHSYENQIKTLDDVERIKTPVLTLDRQREVQIMEEAHALLDGIIPFVMVGQVMYFGMWDLIATWMGVENSYIAMVDEPELVHALMEKLCKAQLGLMEQMDAIGLCDVHSNICHCSYTFSDVPKVGDGGRIDPVCANAWGFGLAQLFTSVSPGLMNEFEFEYMKPLFERCGAIYYGCCDRLDDRMEYVDQLPNVRKVSCSPWSDRERFAEKLPQRMIMSNKPTPAMLAGTQLNEDALRADLRRTIEAAKAYGRNLEIILKDISTVRGNPAQLHRWAQIAMEEVQR